MSPLDKKERQKRVKKTKKLIKEKWGKSFHYEEEWPKDTPI